MDNKKDDKNEEDSERKEITPINMERLMDENRRLKLKCSSMIIQHRRWKRILEDIIEQQPLFKKIKLFGSDVYSPFFFSIPKDGPDIEEEIGFDRDNRYKDKDRDGERKINNECIDLVSEENTSDEVIITAITTSPPPSNINNTNTTMATITTTTTNNIDTNKGAPYARVDTSKPPPICKNGNCQNIVTSKRMIKRSGIEVWYSVCEKHRQMHMGYKERMQQLSQTIPLSPSSPHPIPIAAIQTIQTPAPSVQSSITSTQ